MLKFILKFTTTNSYHHLKLAEPGLAMLVTWDIGLSTAAASVDSPEEGRFPKEAGFPAGRTLCFSRME